jgi:hypothetical protein
VAVVAVRTSSQGFVTAIMEFDHAAKVPLSAIPMMLLGVMDGLEQAYQTAYTASKRCTRAGVIFAPMFGTLSTGAPA